jgi:Uma2 family endonuclease
MAISAPSHRFTVADYYKMAEAGILGEDDRVELIEGEILDMAAIGPRHAACVDRLNALFAERFRGNAIVRVQSPVHLNEYSEPQPDLALLRPRSDFYASAHPLPSDVLLVVEVADTSLAYDRDVKARLYARREVPEFWLVNLDEYAVTVYRAPEQQGYSSVQTVRDVDSLSPQAFPDLVLTVRDILG